MGLTNDMELEWDTARARIRAERECGELLAQTEKADSSPGNQHTGKMDRSRDVTSPKTLDEMGATKRQSSDWQKLAAVPEEVPAAHQSQGNPMNAVPLALSGFLAGSSPGTH